MTPLDQLRLRLPAHEFDLLMQAIKPVAEADRTALEEGELAGRAVFTSQRGWWWN